MKSAELSVFYAQMEQLRVFDAVDELNSYITAVRHYFADELNDTDRELLDYIAQNAVKYLGVFGQKVATVAAALDKGAATVRRSIAKLERLGVIKRIPYLRPKSGGNGANIITFVKDAVKDVLPVKDAQPGGGSEVSEKEQVSARVSTRLSTRLSTRPSETSPEAASAEGANFESKTLSNTPLKAFYKDIKRITYSDTCNYFESKEKKPEELGKDYAHYDVPPAFANAVAPIDRTARAINFAWNKVRLAYAKSGLQGLGVYLEDVIAERLEDVITRAKSVIGGVKAGTVNDFGAVLYTAMLKLFHSISEEIAQQQRQEAAAKGLNGFFYDWLRKDEDSPADQDEEQAFYASSGATYVPAFNWLNG